jgi:hypothetical protein
VRLYGDHRFCIENKKAAGCNARPCADLECRRAEGQAASRAKRPVHPGRVIGPRAVIASRVEAKGSTACLSVNPGRGHNLILR